MAHPESLKLSQLSPERIKSSVNRRITETRRIQTERSQAVQRAVQRGEASFLIARSRRGFRKERLIQIVASDEGKHVYFGSAVVDSKISDIENPNHPFDFFVKEGRDIENIRDVALSLAEYISEFFPEAKSIPIAFYASKDNYKVRKSYSKFSYPEDFATKE